MSTANTEIRSLSRGLVEINLTGYIPIIEIIGGPVVINPTEFASLEEALDPEVTDKAINPAVLSSVVDEVLSQIPEPTPATGFAPSVEVVLAGEAPNLAIAPDMFVLAVESIAEDKASSAISSKHIGKAQLNDELNGEYNMAATTLIDWSLGIRFNKTLTDFTAFTQINVVRNKGIVLVISGDFTFSLPPSWKWVSGTYVGTVTNYIYAQCIDDTAGNEIITYQIIRANG